MYCRKCGTALPEDSQFCRKCSIALPQISLPSSTGSGIGVAVAPAPEEQGRLWNLAEPEKPKSRAPWVLIPVLVLVIFTLIYGVTSNNARPFQTLAATQYTATLPQNNFTVGLLSIDLFKFEVPEEAFSAHFEGNFSVSGDSENDIEAYIFNEDGFASWQNGHGANPFYDSGRVTRGNISTNLPGGGTYYVVFSNRFSFISAKDVQADVTLFYSK